MPPFVRHLVSPLVYAGLRAFRTTRAPRLGLTILLFHDIPAQYRNSFERFIAETKRSHGFVTPAEAEAWLLGQSRKPGTVAAAPCLLTFDDGFASNFDVAGDILARHDDKALFFVCPGLVDIEGDQARRAAIRANIVTGTGELPPDLALMTWDQLHALRDDGHAIGCHGMSHRRLAALSADELATEVDAAADLYEARMGAQTPWFAYAFGDIASVDAPALRAIARRFALCRSGIRGLNTVATPPTALLAQSIDPAAPFTYQRLIADGGLDFRYRRARDTLSKLSEAAFGPGR